MPTSTKDYDFKAVRDGQSVGATVYWGDSSPEAKRPIALLFHGGAFVVGTRFMISSQHIAELLAAGFVAVSADYSLCPQVSLYEGPQEDARGVYRWCKTALPGLLSKEGVTVDPSKVVAVGYSAGSNLALCLGLESDPPAAILDFYGPKFFTDPFWTSPLPAMAKIPNFDDAFLNKIYDGPLKTSTASSLEKDAAKRTGPPKPDLTVPRNAWLFNALKHGTQIKLIVKDGNVERVDPTSRFTKDFPPTFFLHGDADDWILPRFSEAAHKKLKDLGVETELIVIPGLVHGFDATLSPEDERYGHVRKGFEFLKQHV